MRRIRLLFFLLLTSQAYSQELGVMNYLVLGVEDAKELFSVYFDPLNQGLMYGLTGGWNNTARVKEPWALDISLVSNGSFVPKDRLSMEINTNNFDDLRVLYGADVVWVPTIVGSKVSDVTFVTTLDGEEFEFDAPIGLGLLFTNLLPNAVLQAGIGLPGNTEFNFRYFPKINIDEASVGVVGFGLKHEITKTVKKWETLPVAISAFAAYTRLDLNYDFQTGGIVTGNSQSASGYLNTILFELTASTKNPIWNIYGGIGYVSGESNYAIKGTYVIETESDTLTFTDPFNAQSNISGFRANIGGRVNINRFSINLDYTLQGYNNISIGFNYNILKGRSQLVRN